MTNFHQKRAECICECLCGIKKEEGSVQIPWPLALWTVFEVVMNAWILITMFKVGISK